MCGFLPRNTDTHAPCTDVMTKSFLIQNVSLSSRNRELSDTVSDRKLTFSSYFLGYFFKCSKWGKCGLCVPSYVIELLSELRGFP